MTTATELAPDANATPGFFVSPMSVIVRRGANAPELTRLPVLDADLMDVFGELWLERHLRRGRPDFSIDRLIFRATPLVRDGSPRCDGIVVEAEEPDGDRMRRELTTDAVHDIALRGVHQQIQAGALKADDQYFYELVQDSERLHGPNGELFKITARSVPLQHLPVLLPRLVERSRAVVPADGDQMPVFFTVDALARAERFARKGAASNPAIETGAVYVGPVCSCPETGEFFLVVCDALELVDAEGTKFSLAYTGKTWARIQVVVRSMQSRHPTRAHRIVGQAHGHNWVPGDGAPLCDKCAPGRCARQNCFASLDDRTWMRSVFSRQPWQLCHIFGLNARREPLEGLFGLCNNQLQLRGYRVLPDFDPARDAVDSSAS